MLLLSSPRSGRPHRASPQLLAAVLLCAVSVSCGLPVTFYSDLDEEIDFLQSVIEKQEVSHIKIPKETKHPAAVAFQTDAAKTNASKLEQKNRAHPSLEGVHAATAAPGPALSDPPSSQPRVGGTDPLLDPAPRNDMVLLVLISLCVVIGTAAVILATVCYIATQKEARLVEKVDYPAFGGAGLAPAPAPGSSVGDKTLAQNAQMYHYQHQKQQMLSMGNQKPEQKVPDQEATSDEEEVGGDFTVYECPGLAPTGEMEVKNPLFDDSDLHYQGNHK